jgi:hypothetical protein
MEAEQKAIQEIKVNKDLTLKDFKFFVEPLLDDDWIMYKEFEAVPVNNQLFTLEYQASYWYILYHLLRDKQVQIDKELFDALMNEKNVFFDTITLENKRKHRKILRNDGGNWTLIFMQEDQDIVGNIQKLIYGK